VSGRNRSATRPNIRIGIEADYANITRFGRKAVIAKGRATPARTYRHSGGAGFQNRPFRARMLKFEPGPPGSGFRYRRRVRAFRPKGDWVRAASDRIQQSSEDFFQEFTDEVQQVLLREDRKIQSKRRRVTVQVASRSGRFS
jgi:hypothetical protein